MSVLYIFGKSFFPSLFLLKFIELGDYKLQLNLTYFDMFFLVGKIVSYSSVFLKLLSGNCNFINKLRSIVLGEDSISSIEQVNFTVNVKLNNSL